MAMGLVALLACSACGQEPSALPPTGTHDSVASGQQLSNVLSAGGGQYDRPPSIRGDAVHFNGVTRMHGEPPGEVTADLFLFTGEVQGRAIVTFRAKNPELVATIDTIDVQ